VFHHAAAVITAGVVAWEPWAGILDLTELEYEWGDGMTNVLVAAQAWYRTVYPIWSAFSTGERPVPEEFPIAVIVSDRNREGLRSLAEDYMQREILMRDSLEEVVRELDQQLVGVAQA
jgi:hypothetical protein